MISTFSTFELRSIECGKITEYWINSSENNNKGIDAIAEIAAFLDENAAQIVSLRIIGTKSDIDDALSLYGGLMNKWQCPPLLIRQDDAAFGIQIYAISGTDVSAVYFDGELVGRKYLCDGCEYYLLRILPEDLAASEYDQTLSVYRKTDAVLKSVGSSFYDTIRTWLYACDILSWYGELNKARNLFFTQNDVFGRFVPASTGIGVDNHHGTAIATQILAIKSPRGDVMVEKADSPLQCPALDYKSSFSRGVIVQSDKTRRLYVSGTASIDKTGKTVFLNDTPAQIEMTMQVVDAILKSASMDWQDTVSAIVYFKDMTEFYLFDAFCEQNNIDIPHIKVHSDVCRDDLLFEIELDAVRK